MNIDLLFPTLTGDLTKVAQADPTSSEGAGQEFEDMLVQQSKAQQAISRPQNTAEDKKAPEKPEQKSTQEDEAAEEGGELAAALVTSQPVVPIAAFEEAEVKVAEDGTVILEPVMAEGAAVEQTAEVIEAPEAQPETTLEQPAGTQPQETPEVVEEAPKAEQPKTESLNVQEETKPQDSGRPEVTVESSRQGDKPQDEDMDTNVEQQSQPVFNDVKAAPVKVGDVQQTVDVEEPEAPQQIASTVMQAVEQGQDVVRLQLNPANLGNLTIELSRDANGVLHIAMTTDTARAANMLSQHSSQLLALLANEGESPVIYISTPENAENAGMMMNPDGHNGEAGAEEDDEKKKKRQDRTEGVNAADFLSQLRLGLIDTGKVE